MIILLLKIFIVITIACSIYTFVDNELFHLKSMDNKIKHIKKNKECKKLLNHNLKHTSGEIFICQDCKTKFSISMYNLIRETLVWTEKEYKFINKTAFHKRYYGSPTCGEIIAKNILE